MDSREIWEIIQAEKYDFEKISDRIWDYAEIRYKEYQSSQLQCRVLKEHGFAVTEALGGIATAFMGQYGEEGPVLGFLGEFDALPELSQEAGCTQKKPVEGKTCGHGCGHHLLGTGSLEAACAIKELISRGKIHGTVRYYGCPAEEGGAGKGLLVRAGVFKDVDICLTWHPSDVNGVMNHTLANMRLFFDFYGKSAHAGAAPHMGRSALDALELTNVGCNYLREHIIPEARIHYAVTDTGGTAPNVVQAFAQEIYCLRAPQQNQLKSVFERVCNVARGAAMMTDTSLNIRVVSAYANILPNRTLCKLVLEKFKEFCPVSYTKEEWEFARQYQEEEREYALNQGIETQDAEFSGSTDVGDVSWNVPTVSLTTASYGAGTVMHTWRTTAQGKSSIAKKGMHLAACVMAAAAAQLYEEPKLREQVRGDFVKELGGRKYFSLIPADAKAGEF